MAKSPPPNQSSPKQIVFLSGLPRTGSTALLSCMQQDKRVFAYNRSPLIHLLLGIHQTCNQTAKEHLTRIKKDDFIHFWSESTVKVFYNKQAQPFVIDKNMAWCRDELGFRNYVNKKPRIVIMVRSIVDITKSFVLANEKNKWPLPQVGVLTASDPFLLAIKNVAYALKNASSEMLFVTYDEWINNSQNVLCQVSNFWEFPLFDWNVNDLKPTAGEDDERFDTNNYHEIRPKLESRKYDIKLDTGLLDFANRLDEALWHDFYQAKKTRPDCFIL
jgi:hypothetical protein